MALTDQMRMRFGQLSNQSQDNRPQSMSLDQALQGLWQNSYLRSAFENDELIRRYTGVNNVDSSGMYYYGKEVNADTITPPNMTDRQQNQAYRSNRVDTTKYLQSIYNSPAWSYLLQNSPWGDQ